MLRTITTIVNDVLRQAGRLKELEAEWEIPIELDDGWERKVSVTVSIGGPADEDKKVSVSVYAYGFLKRRLKEGLSASSPGFYGCAPAHRLTRKWVDEVLSREIETARLAAASFTEADLRRRADLDISEEALEEYQHEREYFESTLDV